MIRNVHRFLRIGVFFGLSVYLVMSAGDAWTRGPRAAVRARPNVSREGPARGGSFRREYTPAGERNAERGAPDRSPRSNPSVRPEPGRERRDAPRAYEGERPRPYQDDDRRGDDRQDRRDDYREADREPPGREYREDRVDRYSDRRAFARGATYSSTWYRSQSCSDEVVVVDGYSYYRCDDVWFGRTYYGGEVIYTVVDAPPGY